MTQEIDWQNDGGPFKPHGRKARKLTRELTMITGHDVENMEAFMTEHFGEAKPEQGETIVEKTDNGLFERMQLASLIVGCLAVTFSLAIEFNSLHSVLNEALRNLPYVNQ